MATVEQLNKKLAAKQEKIGKLTEQLKEEKCALAGIKDQIKAAKAAGKPAKTSTAKAGKKAGCGVRCGSGRKGRK